jgi:hypothetical protein
MTARVTNKQTLNTETDTLDEKLCTRAWNQTHNPQIPLALVTDVLTNVPCVASDYRQSHLIIHCTCIQRWKNKSRIMQYLNFTQTSKQKRVHKKLHTYYFSPNHLNIFLSCALPSSDVMRLLSCLTALPMLFTQDALLVASESRTTCRYSVDKDRKMLFQ